MDHLSFYHLSSVYLYHLLTYPSMYLSTNHLYLYPSIYYLSTYLPTSLPISAVCHLSIIKKARENIQFRIQWGAYFKTCVVFPFLLVSKCSPVGEDFISLPREGLFLCGFGLGCGVPLTPPPPYTFLCTHHSFRGFSQSSESSFLPNWGVGYPLLRRSVVLCRDHSNFTTRTVCPREGRPCGHRVLPVRGCSETGSSSWACRWPLPGSAASFVEDHSVRSWPHARQASCGNVVVWHFF